MYMYIGYYMHKAYGDLRWILDALTIRGWAQCSIINQESLLRFHLILIFEEIMNFNRYTKIETVYGDIVDAIYWFPYLT